MGRWLRIVAWPGALILLLALLWRLPAPAYTRLELTDAETGRTLLATVLREGEQVTISWTNSLFGLHVNEVFVAERGQLKLRQVAFSAAPGFPSVAVTATDVEDLYHTGGAFSAQGLNRPFERIVFRIGEIGEPRLRVGDRIVDFRQEVGFGGGVILAVRRAWAGEAAMAAATAAWR